MEHMGNLYSCCLLNIGEIKHIYITMYTVQKRESSRIQENVKLAEQVLKQMEELGPTGQAEVVP